jgi:hypothetical protein
MEIRTALAHSHIAQAESLRSRLDHSTYMEKSSKEVLWAIYFSHLHAAERLLDV